MKDSSQSGQGDLLVCAAFEILIFNFELVISNPVLELIHAARRRSCYFRAVICPLAQVAMADEAFRFVINCAALMRTDSGENIQILAVAHNPDRLLGTGLGPPCPFYMRKAVPGWLTF